MSAVYGLMADLHLHRWSSFAHEVEGGINSRLFGLLTEIERCAKEVHAAGGNKVVMAGDVFHVRGSVAPSVLNPTKDALASINDKFGTQFIIIPGNHDLEGKETTRLGSAVTALECAYVKISNETGFDDDLQAVLFPWFEKVTDLKAELERCAPKEGEVFDAIIHAPIDGVITGLPLHGLEPEYLASLGYRRVFAGHYHNHKAFAGGAVSIGALAHHTWSDIGTKAGFLLVNTGMEDYRWLKSHLPEFIDLTKLACEIDHADTSLMVDGHYVRVRVEASKTKDIEEARQELLDMGALAVLVQAEPKPPVSEARAGHTVETGASLEVSVSEFVKSMTAVSDQAAVAAAALSVLGSIETMR
jgi:DNA repair exonuclease SbcCD nuclease subunit